MTEAAVGKIPNIVVPQTRRLPGDAVSRCTRCLYDAATPGIRFDPKGICNYCEIHDSLDREYPTGAKGEGVLRQLANEIKRAGRKKPYDVIIGVSGGCDSTYMLYLAKEILGLRPLAVHFDNTWNTSTSTENIRRALQVLNIDLFTHVVDNAVYDDMYRANFRSGILELDMPTDIALAATLQMAAAKFGIKYIFEGHSFRTEGVSPLGWFYMDGKFIESVVKQYGNYDAHRLRTFPNLTLSKFLNYLLLHPTKKIRPLYWVDYRKEETKAFLTRTLNWQWYGGHHLENRLAAFQHIYVYPRRAGIDSRVLGYAALVRSGQLERSEGLHLLAQPIEEDPELLRLVKRRLEFSDEEFERLMDLPIRTYREFRTYKKTFERLRWFFWLMYKLDRVPKSFYMKYTFPDGNTAVHRAPKATTVAVGA